MEIIKIVLVIYLIFGLVYYVLAIRSMAKSEDKVYGTKIRDLLSSADFVTALFINVVTFILLVFGYPVIMYIGYKDSN